MTARRDPQAGWPATRGEWFVLWSGVAVTVFWALVLLRGGRDYVPIPFFVVFVTMVTVLVAPAFAAPRIVIIAPAAANTGALVVAAVHLASRALRERSVPPRDPAASGVAEIMAWICGWISLLGLVSLGIAGIRALLARKKG